LPFDQAVDISCEVPEDKYIENWQVKVSSSFDEKWCFHVKSAVDDPNEEDKALVVMIHVQPDEAARSGDPKSQF